MKKEVLIAILVGLSMGLIITFGVYRVKTSITEQPVTNFEEEENNPEATATPTILAIHSPEDGLIQTEKELIVTGTTIPDTFVVVFVNNQDYISTSDESGNFSVKVKLDENENIIRVHVINKDNSSVVEERLVVVSNAFKELEAKQKATEASESAQAESNNDN